MCAQQLISDAVVGLLFFGRKVVYTGFIIVSLSVSSGYNTKSTKLVYTKTIS